jgi:hypothetical protein
MTKQLLSDQPVSRTTDPVTSHLAEIEINATGQRATQQQMILDAVVANPGLTSSELTRKLKTNDRYVAARRLPELRNANLLTNGEPRKCMVTNRMALTWDVVSFQRELF